MHWEQMNFKTILTVCSSPVNTRPDRDLQDVGGATLVKQVDSFRCVFVNTQSETGTDEKSKTSRTMM